MVLAEDVDETPFDESGNGFALSLPARSATVAVLRVVSDLIFRDGFDSGATRNWSEVFP